MNNEQLWCQIRDCLGALAAEQNRTGTFVGLQTAHLSGQLETLIDLQTPFQLDNGCDSDDSAPITRKTRLIGGQYQTTYYTSYGTATQAEHTLVGDFVDCGTGDPVPAPVLELNDDNETVKVWTIPPEIEGMTVELWREGLKAVSDVNSSPRTVFTGPVDQSGMPAHINGTADQVLTVDEFKHTQIGEQDQSRYSGWFYLDEDAVIGCATRFAQDATYYFGDYNGVLTIRHADTAGPISLPQPNEAVNLGGFKKGWHRVGVLIVDDSVHSGIELLRAPAGTTSTPIAGSEWQPLEVVNSSGPPKWVETTIGYNSTTKTFYDLVTNQPIAATDFNTEVGPFSLTKPEPDHHLIEGCVTTSDGDCVSGYTLVDDNGSRIGPIRYLTELGFNGCDDG